jgi:hypothetical protein
MTLDGNCASTSPDMKLMGLIYLNPPMNTPSIAAGLDGDEIGIVGASPTIDSGYKVH